MEEARIPRWEGVATFALVAVVLAALYEFSASQALHAVREMIGMEHIGAVLILGFWIAPAFSLLGLAIASDVWRRERVVRDALILVPICALMPVVAALVWLAVAVNSDGWS